ncbi:MAG: PSP1 domain-containing protein [Phycisphaerales bacterium]
MTISPLPQFEADLADYLKEKADRDAYEKLNAPSSIVVRFGYSMMVGEFPYQGEVKPGCGSKLVVKTQRGTEMGEMLTSTCANSGCSKSVSRKEMLKYIENSGGRKYPFYDQGQVLRVATKADMDEVARLEQSKHGLRTIVRSKIKEHGLDMRLVEVEPILGGERVIVYFSSEERVDFRDLVKELQVDLKNRVELVQVGSRDEARIVADYERCGQYCCCKNFLKVLKPISMKSAKIQKATLDPLKISGRCGRLMCCLRYEDETYDQLRKNLPHRKSRVGTPEGDGMVLDSQILTQLSKIRLDDGTIVAIAIEDLTEPKLAKAPDPEESRGGRTMRRESRGGGGGGGAAVETKKDGKSSRGKSRRTGDGDPANEAGGDRPKRKRRRSGSKAGTSEAQGQIQGAGEQAGSGTQTGSGSQTGEDGVERPKRKRRRGGKRPRPTEAERAERAKRAAEQAGNSAEKTSGGDAEGGSSGSADGSAGKKKRRRRRRRGGSSGGGTAEGSGGGSGGGSGSGSGGD